MRFSAQRIAWMFGFVFVALVVENGVCQESATEKKPALKESKTAQDGAPKKPLTVLVAEDSIKFTTTGNWKSVPPRSRMLDAELKIPKVEGDEVDGRLTIMGAGGSIEANIVRWQGQFTQPDGGDTADKTKQKTMEIDGQKVNFVDITGTFMDAVGGPFSGKPKVERKNYRMLAAIIQTEANGNYFVKLYGPKSTIDKNEKYFKKMLESLKVSD
ncbi:hypothetical protein N9B46_00095 [Mariniblastus sp.]|nr:hypothetical protein [Mariniblastus sp.]